MAYDYALVHLEFTIPLAALLTLANYPFLTRRHWYQTAVLVLIAVVATIPWDSYLVRHHVWTYPPDAILGPTLWSIPAEELFFFVIQTYTTSMIYHLANKPLLHAEYLCAPAAASWLVSTLHKVVQVVIMDLALLGFYLASAGGRGTYLGLILMWACPFALLTWSLGGIFIIALPWTSTVLPIVLPTLYLWAVDEGALRRGTWSIGSGTKIGTTLYGSLELEEAVFFLATNVLIVFGLGAFDHALAVIDAFPDVFPCAPECPSPVMLIRALYMPWTEAREQRISGIREAVARLCRKSRSFYLASSTFSGRLRIDLVLL
ncbi:phytoene synthase [Coniella lustricola]|uniref:Phytoene synthase n=1 Tax=Coniella lustricola TaxID=2025994 RepID=A0A2T2ZSA4_9PEZI|nr:phytoene synthase [Coniella lustricola]